MTETTQTPSVAIPLTPPKRLLVLIGCAALMMFISGSVSALLVLQKAILERLDAFHYYSLSTLAATVGVAIMTPIGGKLGDVIGRKRLVLIAPLLAVVALAGLAFAPNAYIFLFFRLLLGMLSGAFVAAPFILVNQIAESEQVPKYMGVIATGMALGSFFGSFIGGMLADANQLELGVMATSVCILVAVACFAVGLPALPRNKDIKLDTKGSLLLSALMLFFVVTISSVQSLGWHHPYFLLGLAVTVLLFIGFVLLEKKVEAAGGAPVIPMSLFQNKQYCFLLFVGLAAYFYQTPLVAYGSVAVTQILGGTSTMAGTITLPRTLVALILPTFTGMWVAKRVSNISLGIILSCGLVAVGLLPMVFLTKGTPYLTVLACTAVMGMAESFRAVTITPAAQRTLRPENLASGTALVNFFNTLSTVLSSSMTGYLFTVAQPDMNKAIKWVFLGVIVVSVLGTLVAMFCVAPRLKKQ